jgi:PAS domain S-box-containing protein
MTRAKLDARERERLVAAVEQSADGILMTDPELRVSYSNAAFAASVGQLPSELVGRSAVEVASLGLDATTVAAMYRTVSAGERWSTEVDHLFPDGSVHHFETNIGPIRDLRGGISSWVAVLRDVSDRHTAQVLLIESEARSRTSLDTMLEGVAVFSAVREDDGRVVDFRIDYANPALGGISGVLPTAQVGHTLLELFPAHRTNGLFGAYVRVVETGIAFESGAFHYVDPDAAGGPLDQVLEQRAAKLGDGYLLSVRDITERHHAESEMRRMATAIEQSLDATTIAQPDGCIVYVNKAFETETGRLREDLVGTTMPDAMVGVLDSDTIRLIDRKVAAGRRWFDEVALRRSDGTL